MLHREEVEAREEGLRLKVRELPDAERKAFYIRAEKRLKDPDTYAVLNYLFIAGLHHFYLGRWFRGLINLTVFGGGAALIVLGQWQAGLAIIVAITVLELYALFRAQVIVQAFNNRVMEQALEHIQSSSSA